MSNTSRKSVIHRHIYPDYIATGLDAIMDELRSLKQGRFKKPYVPINIALFIHPPGDVRTMTGSQIAPLRLFLRQLKRVQENHFVRFTTDLFWAAQSDCAHLFYTFDGNIRDISEVSMTVSVTERGFLDILIQVHTPTKNHQSALTIAKQIKTIVSQVEAPYPDDAQSVTQDYISDIYSLIRERNDLCALDGNCHILMVGEYVDDHIPVIYHPIVIIGMSHCDAMRKRKASTDDLMQFYTANDMIMRDISKVSNPEEIFRSLQSMIIENEAMGTLGSRMLAYAYGELLFSYYTGYLKDLRGTSIHDIIVFETYQTSVNVVTNTTFNMELIDQ